MFSILLGWFVISRRGEHIKFFIYLPCRNNRVILQNTMLYRFLLAQNGTVDEVRSEKVYAKNNTDNILVDIH